MARLSDNDHTLYDSLRTRGVLEEVEPHRLGFNGGVILVPCSDGDQFPDIFEHLGGVLENCGSLRRVHTIALNGGPLLLHPDSPLAGLNAKRGFAWNAMTWILRKVAQRFPELLLGESGTLAAHIIEASQLKGISTVALCAHGPCGKAYGGRLNLAQVIELLKGGKRFLEQRAPNLVIHPFIQIDIPEDDGHRQRTYFVSGTRWDEWCLDNDFTRLLAA